MTLSSHLELLPVFQQLEKHCMKQVIIVELLSENHTFQSKTVETDWNGAKDTKNGQMSRKKVIWSDESQFTLFQSDDRTRVWRLTKEKYDVNCVVPTVKHGGGGVMVWGCFTWTL